MKNSNPVIKIMLILFVIFSAMPFLPEALNNILLKANANIRFEINEPLFGVQIRYVKDVIMVLILGLVFLNDMRATRYSAQSRILLFYYAVLLWIVCGYATMYYQLNSNSLLQAAAGIRPILLFVVCYKAASFFKDESFRKVFSKTLAWLVIVELIVIILQYYTSSRIFGFQNPLSLRLIGTFGGISIAGYFALGAACYFFINRKHYRFSPILQLSCVIIAGLSGTRSAILGCCIIGAAFIVQYVFGFVRSKKVNSLILSVASFGLLGGCFLIDLVGKASERGSIIGAQADGGRIDFFTNIFTNSTVPQILFGNGLGYGTNAAVTLNREYQSGLSSKVMDGTINALLAQFGMIGLSIAFVLFILFSLKMYKYHKEKYLEISSILVVMLLMFITTNILEQFCFLYLLCVTLFTLKDKQLNPIKGLGHKLSTKIMNS